MAASPTASLASDTWSRIAAAGVPDDLISVMRAQFDASAPRLSDAPMALRNLERFLTAARNPLSTSALFERDAEALPSLLQLLSTSQYLADLLVRDQECYDLIRMTEGSPVARDTLVDELVSEVERLETETAVSAALRRAKQRETIRIAYGDIVRNQPVAVVARQVSLLADAILEAGVAFLQRHLEPRFGVPRRRDGERARFCVLALGKLGGVELNYSSDIDLIFLYEEDGHTDHARNPTNREYFDRLSRDLVKLVGEKTDRGSCYRIDLRLRPEGARGPICSARDSMLAYYDTKGRTWERQAFIKARPAAGDRALGSELLASLEPWIYRRYLSLADIAGIKSLKRRIEQRTHAAGASQRDVKSGNGGLRDIEFVLQFLQLLNGGALPEVRTGTTLDAIERLERAGCITPQERALLAENYEFLRRLEHRLQILFDLQTHTLPEADDEQRKVAVRMGFLDTAGSSALKAFQTDLTRRTELNRRVLDHLLHEAFPDAADAEPEVDLVNDPEPRPEQIAAVLGRYPFRDQAGAYVNLMSLATERIRFLSTRRCRHFLASIAPRLLTAIAQTPEPDATLISLSRVSDSLGGKAALWELFSANHASLNLYVTLCAACPYLSELLVSNPGMIDELMDSLLVGRMPTLETLEASLDELTRGAEDLDPILHSFKHAQHLRVGVRDILGKDDIRDTHAALADTAETCLRAIAEHEYEELVDKHGEPTLDEPPEDADEDAHQALSGRGGQPCSLVVLALGKLGGREPNYHSDLDLIFLYEGEGTTKPRRRTRRSYTTTGGHFFGELGQRIITVANRLGPFGRLYEVDARLRPTGKSGTLAVTIDAFRAYFASGAGQLWERQALCKARAIYGDPAACERAMAIVERATFEPEWNPANADTIREMRGRLEDSASPLNLKRGAGGTVDTEFLVQMLQLRHGREDLSVRVPGTLDALEALERGGYLSAADGTFFREAYRLLRNVEARIRLMNSAGRHEFPTDEADLAKLAFLMGCPTFAELRDRVLATLAESRQRFDRLFAAAAR
ncbi:bifunctional [glutamate--ammonia ligase]-adenylyl-L-tyrosine phosphorylase/[glutamate--ammonia-ligase] adenylyltransferase [Botrimarina hoheduenensis]|uniref:Glutamate-ammonia-ligase adenylyltransferase n=1 Tax=Botrimarina hoheduenensis TaxID=2528000 RepID=A0A5C5W7Q1_9BACT|nr:bifunctional [glutamate--ammonia ligase]-adenylyl-L-tyrosine phosphorylase/[glutamate--ammonia-ligase] adenylyltransferase [Botrimarina hoheduenensis]TWT46477.1 Glutamate-ammonia-ligase adenylyltransferase [Botrimarina hoheduenensis]